MQTSLKKTPGSKWGETAFRLAALFCTIMPLLLLAFLIGNVVYDAIEMLGFDFVTSFPSRKPELAGIAPALVGSLYIIICTAVIALPLGIGAAVYLEEYGERGWFSSTVDVNISNLAGIPSIIYGLLGLEVFVRVLHFGTSILAGSATLALLVLPILVTATREALKTVPNSIREAYVGMGSTKLQGLRRVVLPLAFPNILTGAILSISRAFGETAPLVVIGAATYMAYFPDGIFSEFTALPIQIFNWVTRPQAGFIVDAAAGIVVLLVALLLANSFAILLRNRLQRERVF